MFAEEPIYAYTQPSPHVATEHTLDVLSCRQSSDIEYVIKCDICEKSSGIQEKIFFRKSFSRLGKLRKQKDQKEGKIRSKLCKICREQGNGSVS